MNTKKIIGMIIGVVLFAVLIAGATFAYLQFSATIQNQSYSNVATRNFTFTTTATSLDKIKPRQDTTSVRPARSTFTASSDYLKLTIKKLAGTPKASHVYLKVKKPTNEFTTTNLIKFAVCRNATDSNCNNSGTGTIPSSASGNWVAVGSLTTGTSEQTLYDDTSTFNVDNTSDLTMGYHVYFWADADLLQNSDLSKKVTLSVYFYAEQSGSA